MIAVRFALYGVLGSLFGLSAFGLYGLRTGERGKALALKPWLVALALIGFVFSAVQLALLAASMAGTPNWPVDRKVVGMLLSGSSLGAAWKARMAALLVAGLAAVAAGRAASLGVVAVAAGVALSTLAWTGHGAAGEPGWAHLIADLLHLLASGAWVGALLGLVLLVTRPAAQVDAAHLTLTHRALHGFGLVGTIVVGAIVVTGLINSWMLVGIGNVPDLGATLYGRLLIAKLVLFAAMLALASLNRFRLTPGFERSIAAADHARALGALRVSLAVETACAVVILALVGWLGTLEPPVSM
jgi:copper resistance protein D